MFTRTLDGLRDSRKLEERARTKFPFHIVLELELVLVLGL
jgi:hypothetical protein